MKSQFTKLLFIEKGIPSQNLGGGINLCCICQFESGPNFSTLGQL